MGELHGVLGQLTTRMGEPHGAWVRHIGQMVEPLGVSARPTGKMDERHTVWEQDIMPTAEPWEAST